MTPGPQSQETPSLEPEAKNRRINRKLDLALLPFLSLLYLFNGLDRGNVGNAQTQGFTHDIGAAPDDLNFAVSIFFLTFVLLQPFSAALGRYLGAERWIPVMMFCWGILTIAQAFIHGRGSLIATRLLIGAFEAGFYPTAVAYLATFYRPFDLALRLALFYGQYAVAGAFSGAIAYGVFSIRGGALAGWQYLFVIEGSLTCFAALVAWVWLPAGPAGATWFLGGGERAFAAERMRLEHGAQAVAREGQGEERSLTRRDVVETAKDWKLWFVLVFNICASVPGTAFSVFLPLVVQGLGYDSLRANLMSVPPYICGAVGLYLFALSSDRHRERGFHICGGIVIALIGLVVMLTATSSGCKYAGLCVLLFGSYVAPPLTAAWLSGNTPEPGKRSLVLGINGWGNLAGVVGSQLYRSEYAPGYRTPLFATLGFVVVALLGYAAYRFTLQAVNGKRLRRASGKSDGDLEGERVGDTRYADAKWTFIYGL
ncbi:MFS general substrate transporter [Coniochaeta ligniaria NRRL 30616]|uniref:MFS general substrate transporter n=1 Tax=Coniochaeta ligniaria NRRL 30616 TaxID=1408157 RepID=A0A1J7ICC4_9PEZI|nr:MFS general substrate transporter [Coniochaeta ligniaria NRRL 30616]